MNHFKNELLKLRYRWSPQQFVADLLAKRWMDAFIPFAMMVTLIIVFGQLIDNYYNPYNIAEMVREFAEFGFVAMAMAFVVISGGIDLSVGSMFAIANFMTVMLFQMFGWPVWLVILAIVVLGALMGACNGVLIGYLKTGAFLTTMVTLIMFRSLVELLDQHFSIKIASFYNESAVLDFLGEGNLFGVPLSVLVLLILFFVGNILLTRSRPGWHVTAIGGARRSARQAGIPVERVIFFTYVISGILSSLGGVVYAARLGSTHALTGQGWEIMALTAVVMGGVSLSGGRGTFGRALIGTLIVMLLLNGILRLGATGAVSSAFLGFILLLAIGLDAKWLKNRHKIIQKIYVVPGYLKLAESPDFQPGSGPPFEINNRLQDVEAIGLDQVEGPEDVILDRQGRLYGSCRQGWIVRFSGPNFSRREVFSRMGGRPLGMAFDKDDNLIVCNGGMGLYGIRPNGEVYKLTDETNRTWWKVNDDSRLVLADDLDIAPDGKIYFSEATTRYEMHEWPVDGVELRGNGRIICYDPATDTTRTIIRNLMFANGICIAHDGQSFLFAETWRCTVKRYWIAGPKKGKIELVLDNMPGNPDNINRASDGNYWLAIAGIMTPIMQLANRMPGFRKRMCKRLPGDEWLFANINRGCILKFSDSGEVLESYWDKDAQSHSMITSMREDRGYLYIGGISNNRIGRIKLENADPNWSGPNNYWGKR